jgi:hypothetical protein
MSTYYTDREYGARPPSIDTIDERPWHPGVVPSPAATRLIGLTRYDQKVPGG